MKPLNPFGKLPDALERENPMRSLPTQCRFEDRDTERVTLFLADHLGGGGHCPGNDDPDFYAAWRLDRAPVRVLAVKRTMPDARARLMLAARREQVSFILVRLARFPEVSGLTLVDIVVRNGDEFKLLTDLSIAVSAVGGVAFLPDTVNDAGVLWTSNALRVEWSDANADERADSLCRAAKLMILALRQPQ